jgi:predicted Zn-ribbon and HTH transcriptional regulator
MGHAGAPDERRLTVRGAIEQALREEELTAAELSRRVGVRERDVADHLAHLGRSLEARGAELHVVPAGCIACGFSFARRERLSRPGACPRCRSTRIDPPRFRVTPEPRAKQL